MRNGVGLGRVQHDDLVGQHFDFAGGQRFSFSWPAAGGTTPVTCTTYSLRMPSAAANPPAERPGIDDDLRLAGAVAQVDKDDAAHVAPPVDPARQRDSLADVLAAKLAAAMRLQHTILPTSAMRLE
jgi:hypothetical protein